MALYLFEKVILIILSIRLFICNIFVTNKQNKIIAKCKDKLNCEIVSFQKLMGHTQD